MNPAGKVRPAFLITIDTEGDNLWESSGRIETRNAAYLPRFQALCERYGFKPTWLTNYEMAVDPVFVEFGRDVLRRGQGEIGMHLHAWNSPPIRPLTADDNRYCPYLIEYPDAVMRDKIAFMTDLLEDTFGVKMLSHRAGRWAFDERYARLLVEFGYRVDCSVTPGVSWAANLGDPEGRGGTDYRAFPDHPYRMDLNDLSREGGSPLLELPMTIRSSALHAAAPWLYRLGGVKRVARRIVPPVVWLRPDGRNRRRMLSLVSRAKTEKWPYLEFMLHSSEFMPGGSPTFRTAASIEALYEDMSELFEAASGGFTGRNLSDYGMDVWPYEAALKEPPR
jgi:hypothetical protein